MQMSGMKNSKEQDMYNDNVYESPVKERQGGHMKRRTKTLLLSVILPSVLGVALIISLIWGFSRNAKAQDYKAAATSMYSRAYSELVSEIADIEVTLSKIQIVGSKPQYILLLDEVWRSCGTCTGLLSQIPTSHIDSEEMNQFLIRVGDYSRALATSLLHGKAMTAKDTQQIAELRKTCTKVGENLRKRYESGNYPDDLLTHDGYFESASDEYEGQETRTEYPTLIYDGPFSESAEKAEPRGLTGEHITQTDAYSVAMSYMQQPCGLEFSSDSDGDIPAYDFSGTLADGRQIDISIAKQGGAPVWMMTQAVGNATDIPDKTTAKAYKKIALDFLKKHGFDDMESTYAQYYGGVALINFAATQDDVILYSDLIKIWVDRESGEIVGFDTRNYLYSHVERDLEKPTIKKSEAKLMISENLNIKQVSLALIPMTPETEVLCYEFKGEYGGESFIVYINAQSGEEEQIFRIIDTEDGQLVL